MDPKIAKKTQDTLGKIIKKPPLTDKLLAKPPFRFLHDITTSVVKSTGFMKGLHEDSELNSENVKDKDSKIAFLQKVVDMVGLVSGKTLGVRPSKIVAGHEPEKTNELLQVLAQAINKQVDNDTYVKKVLNKDIVGEEKKDREKEKSEKKKDKEADKNEGEEKRHREKSRDREKGRDREKDGEKRERDREKRDKSKPREDREDRHKDKEERHRDREERHRDKEDRKEKEERPREKDDRHRDREERHRERKERKKQSDINMSEDPTTEVQGQGNVHESEDSNNSIGQPNTSQVRRRSDRPGAAKYRSDRQQLKETIDPITGDKTVVLDEKRKKGTKSHTVVKTESDGEAATDSSDKDAEPMDDRKRKKGTKSRIRVRHSSSKADEPSTSRENVRRHKSQNDEINSHKSTRRTKKKDEEGKENESPEVNGEKEDKVQRPSSAKGSRRRRDGRPIDSDEEDEVEKKTSSSRHESNNKEPDVPPQITNARRQARPSSARPAPPRPKQDAVESEPAMRLGTGQPANVIIDDDKQSDDDDENFMVVDSGIAAPEPEQPPPKQDGEDDENHGGLVKKMLETKKELDNQPSSGPQRKIDIERSAMTDAARRKQREQVQKEIDKLRSSIQSLTRSANPLGKIMDYVQEDLDSMQKELEKWKGENKEHAQALKREKSVTDRAIEPLKAQLTELDQAIKDQLDASAALKSNIIRNDQKIEKMLKSIARS